MGRSPFFMVCFHLIPALVLCFYFPSPDCCLPHQHHLKRDNLQLQLMRFSLHSSPRAQPLQPPFKEYLPTACSWQATQPSSHHSSSIPPPTTHPTHSFCSPSPCLALLLLSPPKTLPCPAPLLTFHPHTLFPASQPAFIFPRLDYCKALPVCQHS